MTPRGGEDGGMGSFRSPAAPTGGAGLLGQLRSLAAERPLIIDALTYMDLQLRAVRVDKERLASSLEAAKTAEATTEGNLSSLRRQLSAARQEISTLSDARDQALDRGNRFDAELKTRTNELATSRDACKAEASKKDALQKALDETRSALALAQDEIEALSARVDALRVDYEAQLSMERATRESMQQLAASSAAETAAAHEQQVNSLMARVGSLEGELDAARHDGSTTAARLGAVTSELDKARSEVQALSGKAVSLEMALAQAESNLSATVERVRELEAAKARIGAELEEAYSERDATLARLASTSGEINLVRSRLSELEALEAVHREDEQSIANFQGRVAELESRLGQSEAETEAAESRIFQLKEQARVDLELAQSSTARVAAELQRVMRAREDDAEASSTMSNASRRSIAQLQAELEAQTGEAAALKDRCRSLQAQIAQLAAEVQDARDQSRGHHDEAIQAKADLTVRREDGRGSGGFALRGGF
jgi:chromosome segregation ATPase